MGPLRGRTPSAPRGATGSTPGRGRGGRVVGGLPPGASSLVVTMTFRLEGYVSDPTRPVQHRTAALRERACHQARFLAVIRGVPCTMACSAVWGGHRPPPGAKSVTAPCRRALDAISHDQLPEPASTRPRRALVAARPRTPSRFGCRRALILKVCAVAPSIRRNRAGGPPATIRHSPPQAHGFAPDFVRSARSNARGTSVRRVPGAASARQRGSARRPA